MKNWIVDRIEGEIAIIESDGEFFEINIRFLPEVIEGTQLQVQKIEHELGESAKLDEAQARLERLKKRSEPPPDVFDL